MKGTIRIEFEKDTTEDTIKRIIETFHLVNKVNIKSMVFLPEPKKGEKDE